LFYVIINRAMNKGRWTEDEIFILEKLAGTCPLIDIVKAVKKKDSWLVEVKQ